MHGCLFHLRVCVYVCVFGVCWQPLALQWTVSQWRGVSLPLDCCLTKRQTANIGSGRSGTPPLRAEKERKSGRGGAGEGCALGGSAVWAVAPPASTRCQLHGVVCYLPLEETFNFDHPSLISQREISLVSCKPTPIPLPRAIASVLTVGC